MTRTTPSAFLKEFWNKTSGWIWPGEAGFVIDTRGEPIKFSLTLLPRLRVDRFGRESGKFLSPIDTPYDERAIPPENLDTVNADHTCGYYRYEVLKPFKVEAGPIAADFGQPGGGLQYHLVACLISGRPRNLNVLWLVAGGYLKRIN